MELSAFSRRFELWTQTGARRRRFDRPRIASLFGALCLALLCSIVFRTLPAQPVSAATCPCSIWTSSTTPGAQDSEQAALELGMKFQADTAGVVNGVRFYKYAANSGTHVGNLWSSSGTKLASVTFTGETSSGWQQATFATPVQIQANTTYVISYHTNTGFYASSNNGLATQINSGNLHALASGSSGGNGVYRAGASSLFPNQTYQATNYWVDVLYTPGTGADTTPPTVTSRTPAAGATGVVTATNVTATFSEAVTAASIQMSLTPQGGSPVTATTTYNSTTNTVTLAPGAALTAGTQYTVNLSGATDAAGNVMAPTSWTFTTVTPDTTPPTITGRTPAANATGVSTSTTVTATFSETVTPASIQMSVTPQGGTAIAATTAYNAGTNTITLTPAAGLAAGTTFTVDVSGATDVAGNAMTATSWAFTTVAADTTPPTVTARTPAAGATGVGVGSTVTATFSEPVTASSIQISLTPQGGAAVAATASYNAGTSTVTLTPTAPLSAGTVYNVSLSGAADVAGNAMTPVGWSFTTASGPACPCSVWTTSTTPGAQDSEAAALELGMKFQSDSSGWVTGVRFYKYAPNTGTHVGNLWNGSGTLLGSVTFTGESASGWQQATFATPIQIQANTTYVISYHTNTGFYAATNNGLATQINNGPLHALASGSSGGNGLFLATATSQFPNQSFQATNYWVDVVFDTSIGPDTTPPTITTRSPANGAVSVATTANVSATFSEPVTAASIQITLTPQGGSPVAATTSYNSSTNTVTLTPAAALTNSTLYTVDMFGATDAAGNAMAATSWSFTTAGVTSGAPTVYFSTSGNTNPPGVTGTADDADIYSWNGTTFAREWDARVGSTGFATAANVDGYERVDATHFYLSFGADTAVPNLGTVQDEDIVFFDGATWSVYFDGTARGLTADNQDIDAFSIVGGALYFSTLGNTNPPGVTGTADDADIYSWNGTAFTRVWDASANGLANGANVDGLTFVDATHFSVSFSATSTTVPGLGSVPDVNIVAYSAGTWSVAFDGVASGLVAGSAQDLDAFDMAAPASGDTTPPSIIDRSPATDATGVDTASSVTVTFNEPMNAASISTSTVQLRTAAGILVSATVSYGSATRTATLTPRTALAAGTTYVVTVVGGSGGVKDAAGNPLASNASWNFSTAGSGAAEQGQFSEVQDWPLVTLNASLLKTGEVLVWDGGTSVGHAATHGGQTAMLWNPTTGTFTPVPTARTDLFCSSAVALSDGRILVVGGSDPNNNSIGTVQTNIFNPTTRTWSAAASMAARRWYPTATFLPDGRVLATSGSQTNDFDWVTVPEVYNPTNNTWTRLTGAAASIPYYPHVFVLPDGRVLDTSTFQQPIATDVLNVATQTRTQVTSQMFDGGSAVQYLPGKIMKSGTAAFNNGSTNSAAATTYVLDMTAANPTWRQTASMHYPRSYHTLTTLPDGSVLVTGGGRTQDSTDVAHAVYQSEIWSPVTETWTVGASMQTPRLYHSTALLLPDGRVLVAGGGRNFHDSLAETNAEIYSPPYLFKGPRPTITSTPSTLAYGSGFSVQTPDAASIASVSLMRLGSVTHGFNEDQNFLPVSFSQNAGSLTVQGPANANAAPPGYYMLFIVNGQGVPSVASIVHVG